MRIAVVNWNDRKIGGAESYLAGILPALLEEGHEVAFWSELSTPPDRRSVVPEGVPRWCAAKSSASAALAGLRGWSPDVLFVHGLSDPGLEAEIQRFAPAAFYAHGYYGTCITGSKTLHRPDVLPCGRRFGVACLAHYYPNRCGGLNPVSMWSHFRLQSKRLEMLADYDVVLCASSHMRDEYLRHGIDPRRLTLLPYPIPTPTPSAGSLEPRPESRPGEPWRIVFVGRLERQKGGFLLLDALLTIAAGLSRPIEVIFAGDGRERPELERAAAELTRREPGVRVEFAGWVGDSALETLIGTSDLLALPSVWPEPFGLVGLEAGRLGVPTVSFAVGGIPDWLEHGVNGILAPASPPTPEGFAAAVVAALHSETHPALAAGARAAAERYSMDAHLHRLSDTLGALAATAPRTLPH